MDCNKVKHIFTLSIIIFVLSDEACKVRETQLQGHQKTLDDVGERKDCNRNINDVDADAVIDTKI